MIKSYASKVKDYRTIEEARRKFKEDFPTISAVGFSVRTMKEQLLKFARQGIEEFEETTGEKRLQRGVDDFVYPKGIDALVDAKAQLMVKGWDSLNPNQRKQIQTYYGKKQWSGYKGMEAATSEQILRELEKAYKETLGFDKSADRLQKIAPTMSRRQAELIVSTEIPQSVEASRYLTYTEAGYNEVRWLTVGDGRVRIAHSANERQGWIQVDGVFVSGSKSPAEEIACRCGLNYRIGTPGQSSGRVEPIRIGNVTMPAQKKEIEFLQKNKVTIIDKEKDKDLSDFYNGYFDYGSNTLYVDSRLEKKAKIQSFFHEVGHAVDRNAAGTVNWMNQPNILSGSDLWKKLAYNRGKEAYGLRSETLSIVQNRWARTFNKELSTAEAQTIAQLIGGKALDIDAMPPNMQKMVKTLRGYYSNPQELFAESYYMYRQEPDKLLKKSPKVYAMFQNLYTQIR